VTRTFIRAYGRALNAVASATGDTPVFADHFAQRGGDWPRRGSDSRGERCMAGGLLSLLSGFCGHVELVSSDRATESELDRIEAP